MPLLETDLDSFSADLDEVALEEAEKGYIQFLRLVVVDSQPVKKLYADIAEPWQWDREHRSAHAIDHLAGRRADPPGRLSYWHGYHKGSDKTHAIARKLLYLLGWSRRALRLYVCAGDRAQAALVTLAMEGV